MTVHPFANGLELFIGGVFEPDTGMVALSFPCQLSIDFELLVQAWQVDREAERVFLRDAAGKLNGHPAFADVNGIGFEPGGRAETFDRNLHRDPQLLSP